MKLIPTLLLTCILIAGVTATTQAQSPVSIGLKGGLNIANLSNTDVEDFDTNTRTGILGGLSLDVNLPSIPFGIETGLYYSQKGASYSGISGTEALKLNYLEVPVMARMNMGLPGPVSPHILAGPYLGFNLNGEIEDTDISDEIVPMDFGLLFGAGLDLNLGLTALNAQIRYGFGLTNVFEDDQENNIRNRVFTIAAGIKF